MIMRYKTIASTFALASALMVAVPAMADGVSEQNIDSGWTFKQVRGNNWYPATVPGVVHTDLMNNGIIEDPFYRLNERGVQWVDKEDWEYKTTLDVAPDVFDKDNIDLDFKGLDTYADVYLNDSCILKANNIEIPVSGGGGLQSIGPGMYLFTMPDGRQITFNDAGEITNIQ